MFQKLLDLFGGQQKKEPPKNRTILYIEDNQVEQKSIQRILVNNGYDVLLADDGRAGLEAAQSNNPDLILLDGLLPDLNGSEVCKRIKYNEDLKKIPVIFLTGLDSPTNVVDCYSVGADQYLNKPIKTKELLEQITITLNSVED